MTSMIGSLSNKLCLPAPLKIFSNWTIDFLKNHPLTVSHFSLVFVLLLSSWAWSGTKWLSIIAIYLLCYSVVAFGFHRHFQKFVTRITSNVSCKPSKFLSLVNTSALVFVFAFPIVWFLVQKSVPLWAALMNPDFYGVARIRASITYDAPWWIPYGVEYLLKGIAPFILVLLYRQRSKLFYPVCMVTWFIAVCMIARMYVIVLFVPLMIYQLGEKRWFAAFRTAGLIALSLSLLCFTANPHVWPRPWLVNPQPHEIVFQNNKVIAMPSSSENLTVQKLTSKTGEDVFLRAFVVPGKVTDQWLSYIPGQKPFLQGCGYKKLAHVLGCDFVNMPITIFTEYYPRLTGKDGYRGSVTASHFINDYVNFGYWGLFLSGLLTAVLLASLESARLNSLVLFAINIMPITLLNEMPLPSVFHSGGMFLLNFLFFMNRDAFAPRLHKPE